MKKGRSKLKKAVVDTNVFVSGLITEAGYPYQLIKQLETDSFILVNSQTLRRELEEVLRRTKFSALLTEKKIVALLRLVDVTSVIFSPLSTLPVEVRDPKDRIVLATALGGRADYLVTGDQDLLVLNGHRALKELKIVSVKEFLKARRK